MSCPVFSKLAHRFRFKTFLACSFNPWLYKTSVYFEKIDFRRSLADPETSELKFPLNEKYAHVENTAVLFPVSVCKILHYPKLVYWTILYRLSGGWRHRSELLLSYGALKIFGQNLKFPLPGHFRVHWIGVLTFFLQLWIVPTKLLVIAMLAIWFGNVWRWNLEVFESSLKTGQKQGLNFGFFRFCTVY